MNDNGPRILVVEDNRSDLELTLRALKRCMILGNINVARDGAEALDFIFCDGEFAGRPMEERPHVILLDLKLPLVDGMEVLRRVRSDPRTRSLPVVVVTASNYEREVNEAHRLGVVGYITKPVDSGKLTEAMKIAGI
jgi:two-component system, response regulator